MEQEKIDLFMKKNEKCFAKEDVETIINNLKEASDEKFAVISGQNFKKPGTMFIVTWFLGFMGIDRFMLGNTGMGVFKLLTLGGFGIVNFIDMFTSFKRTRKYNFDLLFKVL